jgi:succinate dehydrogenase / fumarate reductase flavoprotein subunit
LTTGEYKMGNSFKLSSKIQCDVLIIGAGGAGLRCAAHILEKRPGTRIIAVTKVSHPQKSHTSTAQGGLAAVDPRDTVDKPIYHMFDTWKGSDCMADQSVVSKIINAAWEEIVWLENRGMHFTRDEEGRLSKRTFGGHTVRFGETSAFRAVFEADRTGKGIMDNVWGEALKGGVAFFDQTILTELVIKNDRCVGAVLFREKEGEFTGVSAKAVVLATGGCGQVFRVTTNCRQNTGDAHAVALRAGLPLMDMEAVQFHPTGIVGPGILASETLRSVGGILRNRDLEPFMARYAPKMKELAPRDLVARAIETEIREGRGILNPDHNIEHVWIDLRHLSDYVHEVQIPEVSGFFKQFMNLNPRTQLCPVRPSNHYQMGGIPTNSFGEVEKSPGTVIYGLYAAGECGCASFHGFNRLGTNSILELITMGRFVGERVIEYMKEGFENLPADAGGMSFSQFAGYLENKNEENMERIRDEIRQMMTENVGVFRTEEGMNTAITALSEANERISRAVLRCRGLQMNQELIQRWELDNLLSVSMVIAQGALRRRESRGGHARMDFPHRSDEFNSHTLAYMTDFGKIRFGERRVDMSIFEAKEQNFEKFGIIERKY